MDENDYIIDKTQGNFEIETDNGNSKNILNIIKKKNLTPTGKVIGRKNKKKYDYIFIL